MRIGFLVSATASIRPTWTTAHLAQAALEAGHTVRFFESTELEVTSQGRLVVRAAVLDTPRQDAGELATLLSGNKLTRRYIDVGSLDLMLMRANPLSHTVMTLALMAQDRGVRVLNDPAGMARTRTKTWLATLDDVPTPPTVVTTDSHSAHLFALNYDQGVVLKPAMGSGGRGVRWVQRPTQRRIANAILDIRSAHPGPVVVQAYLPEADQGEKRVFWVEGEVVCAYKRTRPPGGFHHNLQRGGQPIACEVSESDRAIVHAITPHLLKNGIHIAGLDIIGSALIECNTLNPGGIHYAESFRQSGGESIAARTVHLLTPSSLWNHVEASHA